MNQTEPTETQKLKTRVFYKFNSPEVELEFVKWGKNFLVVKHSEFSTCPGKLWKIGRRQVDRWRKIGVLRFEFTEE